MIHTADEIDSKRSSETVFFTLKDEVTLYLHQDYMAQVINGSTITTYIAHMTRWAVLRWGCLCLGTTTFSITTLICLLDGEAYVNTSLPLPRTQTIV